MNTIEVGGENSKYHRCSLLHVELLIINDDLEHMKLTSPIYTNEYVSFRLSNLCQQPMGIDSTGAALVMYISNLPFWERRTGDTTHEHEEGQKKKAQAVHHDLGFLSAVLV